MNEIALTTKKAIEAGHSLGIWRWEVPLYLFLGGLTAGILIIAAWMILKDKEKEFPFSTNKLILLSPIILSIGMFFLFLDLDHKLYVWRFYTAFRITSVMSWGAWILILVYPLSMVLLLATVKKGYAEYYQKFSTWLKGTKYNKLSPIIEKLINWSEKYKKPVAMAAIPVGILLGIYTGILLSAFSARPFWNSGLLGFLFLISGLSTGAALIILLAKEHHERIFITKLDIGFITIEAIILVLYIFGMLSSSLQHIDAIQLILGGELTPVFWSFVFAIGMIIPLALEILELRGKAIPVHIAASLVLIGGLALRFIFVEAGQISNWLPY
ncbi:MAG: NrfD/PsrC family molybdoenzyme membrane anchor subunit [Spirochaetota bacterium]